VIERKFEAAEGAETVGSSHGDFSLVVQTLDNSAGKQLLTVSREIDQPLATYPANLCPLLFGGEVAKFGSDFGEPVEQAVEYWQRITTGLG
jgi:hypothetical protein